VHAIYCTAGMLMPTSPRASLPPTCGRYVCMHACAGHVLYGRYAHAHLTQSFSPADMRQVEKRIHRCGQYEECTVYHLLAHGSPDYALTMVHQDKLALEAGVVDGDWSGVSADKCWRQAGKIADLCSAMDQATGELVREKQPPPRREGGAGGSSSSSSEGASSLAHIGRDTAQALGAQGAGCRVQALEAQALGAQPPSPPQQLSPPPVRQQQPPGPMLPGPMPPGPMPPGPQQQPGPMAWALPPCRYGAGCYQRNAAHLAQYSHPAVQKQLPPCRYGAGCYQKNPAHLAQYSHPSRKRDQPGD